MSSLLHYLRRSDFDRGSHFVCDRQTSDGEGLNVGLTIERLMTPQTWTLLPVVMRGLLSTTSKADS